MKFARYVLPVMMGIFLVFSVGTVWAQNVERTDTPPPQLPGSSATPMSNVNSGSSTTAGATTAAGASPAATSSATKSKVTEIEDPLKIKTLEEFANRIGGILLKIAIPLAAILILYVGFQYMTSSGNPSKVEKANQSLLWILVGIAVIFIGKGFISLVADILKLKDK